MFQTKVVEKVKTRILCSITFFFQKSFRLWDNVEQYGTARQATDDNIIRRMRFPCWITNTTDTHSEHVIQRLLLFHDNNGYANAPQCYICTYIASLVFRLIVIFMMHAMLSCNKDAKPHIMHTDTCKGFRLQVMMVWQDKTLHWLVQFPSEKARECFRTGSEPS
jgi:hypothetical protein